MFRVVENLPWDGGGNPAIFRSCRYRRGDVPVVHHRATRPDHAGTPDISPADHLFGADRSQQQIVNQLIDDGHFARHRQGQFASTFTGSTRRHRLAGLGR